jgi:hypothetical protein
VFVKNNFEKTSSFVKKTTEKVEYGKRRTGFWVKK